MSLSRIPKSLRAKVPSQAPYRCGYCLTAEFIVDPSIGRKLGESGHPRFLGARKWVAPSAPLNPGLLYFFLPRARPVPVRSWSCRSRFGQWSPDPPGLCDRRPPSSRPSARHVETFDQSNSRGRRTSPDETNSKRQQSGSNRRSRPLLQHASPALVLARLACVAVGWHPPKG
jgi:hypothetical protein